MNPTELITKYCYNFPSAQRRANIQFFTQVAATTAEGGHYIWPAMNKVFQVRDGKFIEV